MLPSPKDFDLRNVFDTERKLLTYSGIYPRGHSHHDFLYYSCAFLTIVVSYLQLFSMIVQMVIDRTDLNKLTEILWFFMTHLTFLVKLTNFGYYKENLLTIERDVSDEIFYNFSEKQLKVLTAKFKSCNRIGSVFRWSCFVGIVFFLVLPFMEHVKILPLPGWLPYDTEKFYYETAIFQMLSIYISAYNNTSIDILTWKLMTIAAGELEILKEHLEDFDYRCEDGSNVMDTKTAFTTCVRHHKAIVDLVQKIELTFSNGIFMQFLSSVLIICVTGFQLVGVPIASIKFLSLIVYFFNMLCQVAMYCWCGHEIMTTSDELGRSCYMSNWYESDMRIRKSVIIFLERVKKPMTLTAGKFVTLSLETLIRILRSAYSYFAVLQQLYQEDA